MKNRIVLLVLLLVSGSLAFVSPLWASSSGVTNSSGKSGTFCASSLCHNGGVVPTVALSGPSSVQAGSQATITLSVSGGQLNLVGFNIAAEAGILSTGVAQTTTARGEIKHTSPLVVGATAGTWSFKWQAPATQGTATIYAAAVSANGDSLPTGDNAATTTWTIEVTAPGTPQKRVPIANAGGPYYGAPLEAIPFNASESSDIDGTITRYLWDFGDGSAFGTGVNPTHSYAEEKTYTVTVAVTDNEGITGAAATEVFITSDTGATLYTLYCDDCHGVNGGGGVKVIVGATADAIANALQSVEGMKSISLTPSQVQSIATFLAGFAPPPRPTDGPGLYGMFCAGCHGVDGRGQGNVKGVTGSPAAYIQTAITNVPAMRSISLTLEEIQKVAAYLSAGGPAPLPNTSADLYAVFCSTCHGSGGHGGDSKAVTGASAQLITDAISHPTNKVTLMQNLQISALQIKQIESYLAAGGATPLPTDAAGLYGVFCAVCHGIDGRVGKFKAVTGAARAMIDTAISTVDHMKPLQITATQRQSIADFLAAGGGGTLPSDAAGLYEVFCEVCHGLGGRGGKFKAVTGINVALINTALANEEYMQSLQVTTGQVALIGDYLQAGGGGPRPDDGPGLYNVFCSTCHGANGGGGGYKVVTGSSLSFISSAISRETLMRQLSISAQERQLLATYLASGGGVKPTTGSSLYHTFCETCHGPNGRGGPEESVAGSNAMKVVEAINDKSEMVHLRPYVTNADAQLIGSFLSGGGMGGN